MTNLGPIHKCRHMSERRRIAPHHRHLIDDLTVGLQIVRAAASPATVRVTRYFAHRMALTPPNAQQSERRRAPLSNLARSYTPNRIERASGCATPCAAQRSQSAGPWYDTIKSMMFLLVATCLTTPMLKALNPLPTRKWVM